MSQFSKRTLLTNTFGTLGYLFCLLLWAWVGLLYVPTLLENEQVERFLLPTPSEEVISYAPSVPASPLTVFFAIAITIAILVVTIAIFLRAPIAVARTGKTVTTKAASSALPLVAKGKALPPEKKKRLTAELVKLMKLLLVITPIVTMGIVSLFVTTPLPFEIALFAAVALAILALVFFAAQYLSARLLKVATEALM